MVAPIGLNRQARALLQGLQRVVGRRLERLRAAPPDAESERQMARAQDVLARIDAALAPDDAGQPAAMRRLPAPTPRPPIPK